MLSTLTPSQVVHHHLDLTGQNVLTIGSWVLTFVLLGVAVQLGRKESKTPFYALIVLAAMVAAFAEPLYDVAFSLYFYSTHGMQRTITAFGVPQPIWAYSGYAVLYAAPAVYIVRKVQLGALTRRSLLPIAGVVLLMSCVFEIVGINAGTYTYWGPHVLRIAHYPIVIGVLETAQVISFGIGAALLRQRAKTTAGLFGVFPLFPITFFGANFGAGAAVIIGIHLQHATTLAVTILTLVSIGCAAAMIRAAGSFLPEGDEREPALAGVRLGKLAGVSAARA
jgi:hypothetical protein